MGANVSTGQNSWIKPEIRYDWVGSGEAQQFALGTKRSQFTYGLQSIRTF